MTKSQTDPSATPRANMLLARLPEIDYRRISPSLEKFTFNIKHILYKATAPIDYVYFPTSGIVSAMTIMEDGRAIEVATIGNEGMAGLNAFVGVAVSPNEVNVQVDGEGLRMRTEALQDYCSQEGPLRRLLALYNAAFATQVSYAVACNGLHKIEKRCCRWLLMTQDRVGSPELLLTHEFLAIMLGVQRSSLTEVLRSLQMKKLISNVRGRIVVLDREGLEATACECYRRVREEYIRLLG